MTLINSYRKTEVRPVSHDLLGGRYRLEAVLGRGGVATVWRGMDTRLDRLVAVKVLDAAALTDPTAVERFDREARAVARLTGTWWRSTTSVLTATGTTW
jgi:serine/threonine protein kinase